AGLAVALAVVAGGLAIAYRWDSQLLATFCVLGSAISAPVLTRGFAAILIGFLLVLQAATTPVQLRKRWGVLTVAAAAPSVLGVLALLCAVVWAAGCAGWLRVGSRFALAAGAGAALAGFEAISLACTGDVRAIALLGGGALLAGVALRLNYPAALRAAIVFAA